jgi:hypothetical protein
MVGLALFALVMFERKRRSCGLVFTELLSAAPRLAKRCSTLAPPPPSGSSRRCRRFCSAYGACAIEVLLVCDRTKQAVTHPIAVRKLHLKRQILPLRVAGSSWRTIGREVEISLVISPIVSPNPS